MSSRSVPLLRFTVHVAPGADGIAPAWPGAVRTSDALAALPGRLARIRDEICGAADVSNPQEPTAGVWPATGVAFIDSPHELYRGYRLARQASELGQVMRVAWRLRGAVDRVLVVGDGAWTQAGRALMNACCQPHFNELSRGQRGSYPRVVFHGNCLDSDALQGLLHLAGDGQPATSAHDRWALVAIRPNDESRETGAAIDVLLDRLRRSSAAGGPRVGELVIPMVDPNGPFHAWARELGCDPIFPLSPEIVDTCSAFTAAGLVPAAILGLDIMRLLEGAIAVNQQFRWSPLDQNLVLMYARHGWLTRRIGASPTHVWNVWSDSLAELAAWYEQLLAGGLSRGGRWRIVISSRDLQGRAVPFEPPAGGLGVTNVIVQQPRCDPLAVPHGSDHGQVWPDLLAAALAAARQAQRTTAAIVSDLCLPGTDEASIGQLLELLMLATVVESGLEGLNPFRQPGVKQYQQAFAALGRSSGATAGAAHDTRQS